MMRDTVDTNASPLEIDPVLAEFNGQYLESFQPLGKNIIPHRVAEMLYYIVNGEKFFTSETPHLKGATLTVKSFKPDGFVSKPTLETENIYERIQEFHARRYVWTAWTKLIRRDFMTENGIEYPLTLNNEDLVFTIFCLSCAKRFVKFPDPVNIYRYRPNSILRTKVNLIDFVRK